MLRKAADCTGWVLRAKLLKTDHSRELCGGGCTLMKPAATAMPETPLTDDHIKLQDFNHLPSGRPQESIDQDKELLSQADVRQGRNLPKAASFLTVGTVLLATFVISTAFSLPLILATAALKPHLYRGEQFVGGVLLSLFWLWHILRFVAPLFNSILLIRRRGRRRGAEDMSFVDALSLVFEQAKLLLKDLADVLAFFTGKRDA